MAASFEQRLRDLQIELPTPSTPGANFVQFVRTGNLIFLTGQLSQWNGERRFIGKLGREFGVEEGRQAARLCALNLIAHLRTALEGVSTALRRSGGGGWDCFPASGDDRKQQDQCGQEPDPASGSFRGTPRQ